LKADRRMPLSPENHRTANIDLGGLPLVKKLRLSLYIGIVLVCLFGFIFPNRHPHFWWQKIPVFDAVFGFAGCIVIILFAKTLGHFWLTRNEDYYD
jgi:hypothetical protein